MSNAIICDLCQEQIQPHGTGAKIEVSERSRFNKKFNQPMRWDVHPLCLNELMKALKEDRKRVEGQND